MKWIKKGHEFDSLGEHIKEIKAIYLFGAGINGRTVHNMFSNSIHIKGFIDNDPVKCCTTMLKSNVYPPGAIRLANGEAIVICVQPSSVKEIMSKLKDNGYVENVNVFSMHLFFPVYEMYANEKICLPSLSFLPTTVCNLNCRHCLNFAPYIKRQSFRPLALLQCDLDLLFSSVDILLLLHISGGEPFIYPQLPELVEYIHNNFQHKIGRLEMTTNGTVIPSDRLCEILKRCGVLLTVDDYLDSVPQFSDTHNELIKKLLSFDVAYRIFKVDSWIDLAPLEIDNLYWDEERLCEHFDTCAVPWQEYRDEKLWLCNYAGYATIAGLTTSSPDEFFDVNLVHSGHGRELLEFRMGYSTKGYTQFCKCCRGYGNNTKFVKVAEQMEKR